MSNQIFASILKNVVKHSILQNVTFYPQHFLLSAFNHDNVVAFASLGFAPFGAVGGAGRQFKCNILKLGHESSSGLPA